VAQAAEFIEEKEGKYLARIAQGGSNVSGGQKQRLSIARFARRLYPGAGQGQYSRKGYPQGTA